MKIYRKRASAASYYEAKRDVTTKIVKRLSRGNVKAQNGSSSSKEKLLAKSRDADERMRDTKRLVEASH